jgi:hypothetical protein
MKTDPVDDFISRFDLPRNRETYLGLLFLDGERPDELDPEVESTLPDYARLATEE